MSFVGLPPARTTSFRDTIINAGQAGELYVDREELRASYETDRIRYKGRLNDDDIARLLRMIQESPRVPRRVKQILGVG